MSPEIGLDLLFNDLVQDIAQYIKKEACPLSLLSQKCLVSSEVDSEQFDSRKGATWHCIVGRNFGSFVTHGLPNLPFNGKFTLIA